LEGLTHPLIGACMTRRLERWRQRGSVAVAVLDAPVLHKAGWDRYCDRILFVDAPWEVRVARAAQRGWSRSQLQARQSMQPSTATQRERADVVIDNGGSFAATICQIDAFWAATLPTNRKKNKGHHEI
jgi:dephospho-CoA kinase